SQENSAVHPTPTLVRRRKVFADIAERERAEDGIAQRMNSDIAIRMRNESAADDDVIAVAECVNVVALSNAHHSVFPRRNSAIARSGAVVTLILSSLPSTSNGRCP